MKNNVCGIYKITCMENGKNYIGFSNDISRRWKRHKYNAARGAQSPLYREIRKFGFGSFFYTVIIECEENEKADLERKYIKMFDSANPEKGYNIYKMESKEDKEKQIQLNVDIPADLMKQLKLYCLENNVKIKDVVEEALKAYFSKEETN